jgi:predicted acyltransferase
MELRNRYLSLDVFRGLDVALMIIVNTPGQGETTYAPLLHARWNGFTLTDLVFPTFLFLVGTSMSFSLPNYAAIGNRVVVRKILKRTAIIFLLGYLMYWFPFFAASDGVWHFKPLSDTRILGVLQRIALGYGIAALLIHFLKLRAAVWTGVVLLLLYWVLLLVFGDLTLTGNAVLAFDRWLMGDSHLYHGEGIAFDPEGWLSTLPAVVNVLAGYAVGNYLREKGPTWETLARMSMVGAVLVAIGLGWHLGFPLNKKLWTSSFVVLTIGIDIMVLVGLMYLLDIRKNTGWSYFFVVMGRNTLFIYLLSEVAAILLDTFSADGNNLHQWIFMHGFRPWAGDYPGSLLFAICFMLMCWSVGYFLDRKKIYIRI